MAFYNFFSFFLISFSVTTAATTFIISNISTAAVRTGQSVNNNNIDRLEQVEVVYRIVIRVYLYLFFNQNGQKGKIFGVPVKNEIATKDRFLVTFG
jgi:hypothetical protein